MNRSRSRETKAPQDDLRPEYRLDYSKARPNRFAAKASRDSVVVVLDGEIARVFRTPESVRSVLRALVKAMPPGTPRKLARKHKSSQTAKK